MLCYAMLYYVSIDCDCGKIMSGIWFKSDVVASTSKVSHNHQVIKMI